MDGFYQAVLPDLDRFEGGHQSAVSCVLRPVAGPGSDQRRLITVNTRRMILSFYICPNLNEPNQPDRLLNIFPKWVE
jgi:hypothetical protein